MSLFWSHALARATFGVFGPFGHDLLCMCGISAHFGVVFGAHLVPTRATFGVFACAVLHVSCCMCHVAFARARMCISCVCVFGHLGHGLLWSCCVFVSCCMCHARVCHVACVMLHSRARARAISICPFTEFSSFPVNPTRKVFGAFGHVACVMRVCAMLCHVVSCCVMLCHVVYLANLVPYLVN